LRPGENGFAGRPAGCSLENPNIDYEEDWWQPAQLSELNTNAERLWFNSVDTDTIFWAGIQWLDGQQEAPANTVLPQYPPKLFTRNPAIYFPEVDKTCINVFGMLPGFLENLLESENLLRPQRKPHWVSSSFGPIIFPASWHTLFLRS